MHTSNQRRILAILAILLLCGLNASPALGQLNIIPIFNAGASELPGFDPAASGLMDLINYAEIFFEDVFDDAHMDPHTLTLNFWYEDLNNNLVGQHTLVDEDDAAICDSLIAPSPLCRETEADIRIDTRLGMGGALRNWWIDPTPEDDSEFNMQQTLWRDTSGTNQGDWYNAGANIPETFEVGYSGNAIDPDSDAGGGIDMLSTVLHEVGHALGMSAANNSTVAETSDGDYDFNPDFIFGRTLAADVRDGMNDILGHLDNSVALMNGFGLGSTGSRTLPSHTDLFAMAAGNSFVDLDVPRREFYGGNTWNVDGNWSGDTVPGIFDMAYVRNGGSVALSSDASLRSLIVDEQTDLSTNINRLTVLDSLTVQNSDGVGVTSVSVTAGGELFVGELSIQDNSRVLVGGLLDADDIVIEEGGQLVGFGTVNVSNVIGDFINDGTVAAILGGTLTIDSNSNLLDLDGSNGNGELRAVVGNLVLAASPTDAFNGVATVGAGRTMSFNGGVSIGAGGLLFVDGESPSAATVGGIVTVASNGVLRGDGISNVAAALTLNSGSIVETSDAGTDLRFTGFTTFAGGIVLGTGTVRQSGDADVVGDTTISVATYDMDGFGGSSTIDVFSGTTLSVQSASIEATGGGDGYDGTLNINSGTVDITAAWVLQGEVNLNDTGVGSPVLTGAGGVTVDGGTMNFLGNGTGTVDTPVVVNSGTIFVDNDATFTGPTTFGVGTMVEVDDANDSLRLRGQTTFVGPSIVGSGRLVLEDDVSIALVDTSIGISETDLDGTSGTTTINIGSGLTFSIASTTIEPTANDGFDGTIRNQGTFSVLAGWRLDGTLDMDPIGANTATLNGVGAFEVFTSGVVDAQDSVVINPNTTMAGTINVTNGTTQMNGNVNFESTANVNVTSTGELELNGSTEFDGGSYLGEGTFQWNGPATVSSNTTMSLARVDMDGSGGNTTTLNNSRLTLNVDQVDLSNNRFDGTLNVNGLLGGLQVNLNDANGSWQMDGTLNASGGGFLAQNILQGSDVQVTGTIIADSLTQTFATIDLSGTLTTVDAATQFRFSFGPHIIRDTAVVDGLGTMVINSNGTVLAEGGSTIGINVLNRGRLEPGTPVGIARIAAGYTQEATGTFAVELADVPFGDHDVLNVDRTATLAGEIEVASIDNFLPSVGQSFTLLTALEVIGTFDTLTTLSDSVVQFDGSLVYDSSSVQFQITEVSLFGDFSGNLVLDCADIDSLVAEIANGGAGLEFDLNGDGIVSQFDLDMWLEGAGTFNVGGPYLPGDANLDGFVDVPDFDVWNADSFTNGAGWCGGDFNADGATDLTDLHIWLGNNSLSSVPSLAQVPEPTTHVMGLVALLWLLYVSRTIETITKEISPKRRAVGSGTAFELAASDVVNL